MTIWIDISQGRVGSHKPRKPVDREAIRQKHRSAYWATRALLAKIRRERKSRHR